MMKILGCFKVVPDLEMLSEQDWQADEKNNIDVSFVKTVWNCFDESALEMMLKLSDSSEGFLGMCHLDALTFGAENCEPYLRILYALGYRKTIRIVKEEGRRFLPELTAKVIADYIKKEGNYSAVVMGRQSADEDNGKTPLLTAEILGWPCITQVIGMEGIEEEHLKIKNVTDDGILTQIVKVPVVLSVGDAPNSYLRVPTLRAKMKLGKQPIETLTLQEMGIMEEEPELELLSMKKIETSRQTERIEGNTPEEKAEKLYHFYLKGRMVE